MERSTLTFKCIGGINEKTYFLIFSFILFLLVGCGSNVKIEFETNGGTAVTTITEKSDFDPTNLPYTTKDMNLGDGFG